MKGMAEVIQHVVTPPVDHPRLEDRVIEPRVPDDLLGLPLRLMIGRAALGPRPEEAEEDELRHSRLPRGLDDLSRSLDVDPSIGLPPGLPIDPRAVGDRAATFHGLRQSSLVVRPRQGETQAFQPPQIGPTPVAATGDDHDLVPRRDQGAGQVSSDESGSPGDGDLHDWDFLRLIWVRCKIWVGQTALRKSPR